MTPKELRKIEAEAKYGSTLHTAWLEASWGHDYLEDHVHDMEIELKSARKSRNATKKRVEKIKATYKELTGKEPNWKKK